MRSRIAKISVALAASIMLAALLLSPAHADDPPFGSNLAPGYNLVVYAGGTVEELEADAASEGAASAFAMIDGEFLGIIVGAPDHVNEAFADQYPDGVPAGTILMVWVPVPITPGPIGSGNPPFAAYGTGLDEGDVVGIWLGDTECATATVSADGNWGPVWLGKTVGSCTFSQGDTIWFQLNGLWAYETEMYVAAGTPADVANGTVLTPWLNLEASLGHDWVEGRTATGLDEEFTLEVYDSQGGALLGAFAQPVDADGLARWSATDLGIDLVPDMYLVLSGAGVTRSVTMRSISLGVWTGGTIDDFALAASSIASLLSLFMVELADGQRVVYHIGAPVFVNQAFVDAMSPSFEATEPELPVSGGGGIVWAPLYDSGTAPVFIIAPDSAELLVEWNRSRLTVDSFAPNAQIELTIRDAPEGDLLYRDSITTNSQGDASTYIEIPGGLKPGFEFIATDDVQTKTLVAVDIRIEHVDVDADIVEGVAPPNEIVTLEIRSGPWSTLATTANSSGDWSIDLGAAGTDLEWTTSLAAEVSDIDGDRTSFWTRPPYIYASSPTYVQGYYFRGGVSATLQVFDEPGGALIGAAASTTNDRNGYVSFYIPALGFQLSSGMLVRVSDGRKSVV